MAEKKRRPYISELVMERLDKLALGREELDDQLTRLMDDSEKLQRIKGKVEVRA